MVEDDYDYKVICDNINILTEKDQLLLCAVAESFPRKVDVIHQTFNQKLKRNNQSTEKHVTKHRLRYLQLMKLVRLENNSGIFDLTFPIEILLDLGIISNREIDKIKNDVNNEEIGIKNNVKDNSEVTDKLNALLEVDEKVEKRGWRYLIDKR